MLTEVRTVLRALRSCGGSMAQFNHPDFGGTDALKDPRVSARTPTIRLPRATIGKMAVDLRG